MRRRTGAQWQQLFAEFEASGETATSFCGTRGLSAGYFMKRRRQLRPQGALASEFVPVRMSHGGRVVIQIGDVSIRSEAGVPVSWLRDLIVALR